MIRLRLRLAPRGAEVWAEGHAGYAAPGADIVCAGVSALLYGCLAYLREQCAGQSPGGRARVDLAEGNGFLWYRTRCFRGGADRAALEQLAAGLRLIAGAYPACVALTVIRTDFCKEEGHGRERNEKRNCEVHQDSVKDRDKDQILSTITGDNRQCRIHRSSSSRADRR